MSTIASPNGLSVDRSLVEKYSMRGPRYTSYPTAPVWTEAVGSREYWNHIHDTNRTEAQKPLSLYIHIPFCSERCWYCACNVIITKREDVAEHYVDLVMREVDLVADKIAPERTVIQFHLGGGTPTHLSPPVLDRLLSHIGSQFHFAEEAERSIEVDLRVTCPEHLQVLRRHGFNRISTGVQDFDEETQTAINRLQSIHDTQEFVFQCREAGFNSVNIDLVYGLPYQTLDTFKRTMEAVFLVDPDRIALYNYAYLPGKIPHQRRMEESALPSAEVRFAVFKQAIEGFTANGYAYIGMDHFAKPEDELTRAQQEGTLQRNFMGFTTRAGTDLYAFGVSSISSLTSIYVQNDKNLKRYEDAVMAGDLAIERGMELSLDDRIRRWVIMELMCNLRVSFDRFYEIWKADFHQYFAEEIPQLRPFIMDGLIDPNLAQEIRVTELGQIIVRPIAMVFDYYLKPGRKEGKLPVYSKTL